MNNSCKRIINERLSQFAGGGCRRIMRFSRIAGWRHVLQNRCESHPANYFRDFRESRVANRSETKSTNARSARSRFLPFLAVARRFSPFLAASRRFSPFLAVSRRFSVSAACRFSPFLAVPRFVPLPFLAVSRFFSIPRAIDNRQLPIWIMRGWKQDMVKASLNAIRSEPVVQCGGLEWSWFRTNDGQLMVNGWFIGK